MRLGRNVHLTMPFVFADPIDASTFRTVRRTLDHGPINFVDGPLAKLFSQPRCGLRRAGDEQNASDRGVQPADNAQINISRFVVLLFDVLLGHVEQTQLASRNAHRGNARGLRDDEQVVIFVEDLQPGYVHLIPTSPHDDTMPDQSFRLILASQSPQRRTLLEQAGYSFEVIAPHPSAECGILSGETPNELVARLAKQKAADVASHVDQGIVLACDTIAECGGQILGKPRDIEHARQMLTLLSGQVHHVYSGVCLWQRPANRTLERVDVTKLRMTKLAGDELERYLESEAWVGKAGAFGYQEGPDWLQIIAGSESNVIGLPMELLAEMLVEFHTAR